MKKKIGDGMEKTGFLKKLIGKKIRIVFGDSIGSRRERHTWPKADTVNIDEYEDSGVFRLVASDKKGVVVEEYDTDFGDRKIVHGRIVHDEILKIRKRVKQLTGHDIDKIKFSHEGSKILGTKRKKTRGLLGERVKTVEVEIGTTKTYECLYRRQKFIPFSGIQSIEKADDDDEIEGYEPEWDKVKFRNPEILNP